MGLFSSSKPKEDDRIDFHPDAPWNKLQHYEYDKNTNGIKGGTTWNASFDFANFANIIYVIDQVKELSRKIDKLVNQNQELKERCDTLEKEVGIKRR